MKNGFYELSEKLIEFFVGTATYMALFVIQVREKVSLFVGYSAAEIQVGRESVQPRCPSGRHKRYHHDP